MIADVELEGNRAPHNCSSRLVERVQMGEWVIVVVEQPGGDEDASQRGDGIGDILTEIDGPALRQWRLEGGAGKIPVVLRIYLVRDRLIGHVGDGRETRRRPGRIAGRAIHEEFVARRHRQHSLADRQARERRGDAVLIGSGDAVPQIVVIDLPPGLLIEDIERPHPGTEVDVAIDDDRRSRRPVLGEGP